MRVRGGDAARAWNTPIIPGGLGTARPDHVLADIRLADRALPGSTIAGLDCRVERWEQPFPGFDPGQ